MEEIELTTDENYTIAEYIFSYETDVLIKSDARSLIDLLFDNNIIGSEEHVSLLSEIITGEDNIGSKLMLLIKSSFPQQQIEKIMNEYYGKQ